jgi:hypothetical protein
MPVLENIAVDPTHRESTSERQYIELRLAEIVTPDEASRWMDAPNAMLDDLTPATAIESGQGERVLELVLQVAEGIYV